MPTTTITQITTPLDNRSLGFIKKAIEALIESGVPETALVTNAPNKIIIEIDNPEVSTTITNALAALSA